MKYKVGVPFKKILASRMKDTEFRFYFNKAKALGELCSSVAHARTARRLTQTQLARACKTTQSVIARLEKGNQGRTPSLELLGRIAKALKMNLVIGFEDQRAA